MPSRSTLLSTLALSISTAAALAPASIARRDAITDPQAFSSQSYDYVVIGAGTAGLAVAARLAQDTGLTVGVIEAGQYLPDDPLINIPRNHGRNNMQPLYDWIYQTVPQATLANRTVPHPRGKVVGGSSALNFLMFNRASKLEYDAWSEFGVEGWGWDSMLEGFKASQTYVPPKEGQVFPGAGNPDEVKSKQETFVGTSGEIDVTYNDFYSDLMEPYVTAVNSLGISTNAAPDSGNQTGVYNCPSSVDRTTGRRSYAASGYYASNIDRDNFSVLTGAQVTKINFASEKSGDQVVASSVAYFVNGTTYTVNANKEVILSAGVFQSPQLLELSGIGNATFLQSLGISSVVDLPGVGENLQDHAMSGQMFQVQPEITTWDELRINETFAAEARAQYEATKDGILASTISTLIFVPFQQIDTNGTQLTSMVESLDAWLENQTLTPLQKVQYDIQKKWISDGVVPQMEFVMVPNSGLSRTTPANDTSYVTITAVNQHPFARGNVHINTTDPLAKPLIDPKYINNPFDTQALIRGAQYINVIAGTAPFSNQLVTRVDPASNFTTDAHFEGYVRASLQSLKHPVGTCAMAARDLHGVVGSDLKVHGTSNLRVVDASIIPLHVGAHTQSTAYAIGERAARIILTNSGVSEGGDSSNGFGAKFSIPLAWLCSLTIVAVGSLMW